MAVPQLDPSFFVQNFHLNLKDSALFSASVFFAGVVSDTILRRTGGVRLARRSVIAASLFGAFVVLIPVIFIYDLTITAACLTLAFFFAELVVAPIWSVPMNIAPQHASSASGMMNLGFGLAGIVSPVVFGFLIDATGSWALPFIGSIVLLLIGVLLALRLRPDLRFEEDAPA